MSGATTPKQHRVVVVGAGIMGVGIAQVAAQAGHHVDVVDSSAGALETAPARVAQSLERLVRAGRIDAECAAQTQKRLQYTQHLTRAAPDAWLVMEAVVEDLDVKQSLFGELDSRYGSDTILATNTSQFPIGRVGERCRDTSRVIGVHWSNPPPIMAVVEVITADATSPSTLERVLMFLERCDKQPVICRRDVPGFISNRLSTVLFMEAVRLVDQGIATPEEVDLVATKMFGHKMGPLATLDLAGLDTALQVSEALDAHYGGDRFTPAPLLRKLVEEGRHGRKSGSGFFDYTADRPTS
jgi:3-hydroxybutyryl-CoA dehydrogenase